MTCLMIDVGSTELSNKDEERLQNKLVGGVILFSRNYKNKKQIKALTASIRKIKKNILIAVDHEGGRVQRFREEFTDIPNMALLGQIYDENRVEGTRLAKLCGQLIAYELGACDIDFSFTPVLDINFGTSSVIGDRSFHQHAKPIVDLASSVMDGLNSGGNSLTITNFSPGVTSVIRLINDASSNTVTNCTLQGAASATGGGVVFLSTGTTTGNDNNIISNNTNIL